MKKILFYTDTSMVGGTEEHILLLASFLPKSEFSVTVACPKHGRLDEWCERLSERGIPVVRLAVAHKHDPRHYMHLRRLVADFDFIHLHLWNPGSCRYAFFACGEKPIVVTEHDPFELSGVKRWIKNLTVSRTKKIIVASEASKKIVVKAAPMCEEKVVVVHNGIDVEGLAKKAEPKNRAKFRKDYYNVDDATTVVLCVAELNERKGQRFLIEAMKKVPKAKLVLIGEGPARSEYENFAREVGVEVLFLGRQKEVAQYMAAADIFVLPSRREAFGLVLLEAAAARVAIIASDVGGIREVIDDGVTGILVPVGDPDAITKAIHRLLYEKKFTTELVRAAFHKVSTQFSATTMALKTAAVYNGLL